jgi:hypothetical protein
MWGEKGNSKSTQCWWRDKNGPRRALCKIKSVELESISDICRWTPTDSFLIPLFPLNALNKQEKAQA